MAKKVYLSCQRSSVDTTSPDDPASPQYGAQERHRGHSSQSAGTDQNGLRRIAMELVDGGLEAIAGEPEHYMGYGAAAPATGERLALAVQDLRVL